MRKITITNAVTIAFIAIIHNSDCNGMVVNWQHNMEILRGEKYVTLKNVKIPIVDTIEKVIITLDCGIIAGKEPGLSRIQHDHHQPQI